MSNHARRRKKKCDSGVWIWGYPGEEAWLLAVGFLGKDIDGHVLARASYVRLTYRARPFVRKELLTQPCLSLVPVEAVAFDQKRLSERSPDFVVSRSASGSKGITDLLQGFDFPIDA